MQFSTLRDDVRDRLAEASARKFADADINRWLNMGYRDFVAQTKWAEKIHGIGLVANQYEYALPSDVIKIQKVTFDDKYILRPRHQEEFMRGMALANAATSDRPRVYMAHPWEKRIRVYPVPSTTSASSTVSGSHNTTVTTITLSDASSFPSAGRVKLNDSEVVLYYAKSGNDLQQCVRGADRTTAASYSGSETAVELDLHVYMSYRPADLSSDTDVPVINEEYQPALIMYAHAVGLMKRDRHSDARKMLELYEELVRKAKNERLQEHADTYYSIIESEDLGDL